MALQQVRAASDLMRYLGMVRAKVVTPGERWRKFAFGVETCVRCEIAFPLYDATIVGHINMHFFEDDGWAELVGPGACLQK
jgi:hypothetical protein